MRKPYQQPSERKGYLPRAAARTFASELIADINAANTAGGSNTIVLMANTTFDLTAVNNTTNGANGLPVIVNRDTLTISGQGGDIIQRDPPPPTPGSLPVRSPRAGSADPTPPRR